MLTKIKCIALSCFVISVLSYLFFIILLAFKYEFNPIPRIMDYEKRNVNKMKYILQWTLPNTIPFVEMEEAQSVFLKSNCKYQNCFVTNDRKLFNDIREFDVILFHGPEIIKPQRTTYPKIRSPNQKYVFVSIESSHYYPACDTEFDGFFNWTWTYKMNSDAFYGYISIWDNKNRVIGPKKIMHWMKVEDMDPISKEKKEKLKTKSKAGLWVVSNCNSKSKREQLVKNINEELSVYNLSIDIYGKCGTKCPVEGCFENLEKDYYFYLAFENSFSEDYVTEKLLHALQRDSVPIVYGAANYTRFMPDGIYLDAKKLNPKQIANKMYSMMTDKEKYYEYFKWQKYYRYLNRKLPEANDYCNMCKMINNRELMEKVTVYENFKDWWTDYSGVCRWSLL